MQTGSEIGQQKVYREKKVQLGDGRRRDQALSHRLNCRDYNTADRRCIVVLMLELDLTMALLTVLVRVAGMVVMLMESEWTWSKCFPLQREASCAWEFPSGSRYPELILLSNSFHLSFLPPHITDVIWDGKFRSHYSALNFFMVRTWRSKITAPLQSKIRSFALTTKSESSLKSS